MIRVPFGHLALVHLWPTTTDQSWSYILSC